MSKYYVRFDWDVSDAVYLFDYYDMAVEAYDELKDFLIGQGRREGIDVYDWTDDGGEVYWGMTMALSIGETEEWVGLKFNPAVVRNSA